ncbi:hypothetical protein M0R72_19220 [Candidatus Pacearchaeota archaeon]|nr:hypothetical protein [Candidatus Pacearchaeota archaeon]
MRKCIGCGKDKPNSEFKGLFGRNGYCSSCVLKKFNPDGLIEMGSGMHV